MNARLFSSTLLVSFSLLTASAAEHVYQFSRSNVPIFDFSQTFETNADGRHESFTLEISPRGHISGPFAASFTDVEGHMEMNGQWSGNILVSETDFRMTLIGRGTFSFTENSQTIFGKERMHGTFRLAPNGEDYVIGRQTVTLCVPGYGCRTRSEPTRMQFTDRSQDGDGEWSLWLNLNTEGKLVTGTAAAQMSNGRVVPFTTRGRSSPATGVTTVRLKGYEQGDGVRLQVQLNNAAEIIGLHGRLFGQRIAWKATSL